jgi:hypothetical protein
MSYPILDPAIQHTAQPVLDAFYEAVVRCGRNPPFKPTVAVATHLGATLYDHARRAIVLVPYDLLPPPRRAAMDRFAAIGTMGLSGRAQYIEVFNTLLVAHELGHWVQEVAQRPLTRWRAEFEANQMMVAFWRENPSPAAPSAQRLANFIATPPDWRSPVPDEDGLTSEAYFNANLADIEASPVSYSWFQKEMVRVAISEEPAPSFQSLIDQAWPV